MRILVVGRNGQIGRALYPKLLKLGDVSAVDREEVDIVDTSALATLLDAERPNLIVNAAAYTDVDGAETDRETAFQVNARAPKAMAEWAAANGAAIVHYSTDYVFDGTGSRPWTETDIPDPVNAYGESKLAGDNAVLESGAPCLILRTSWIYATQGKNFLLTMLRLAGEREALHVVSDQIGAPTSAEVVADVTARILANGSGSISDALAAHGGLLNLTTSGETSWYGFTVAICDMARASGFPLLVKEISAIPSIEYPLPAPRPSNSRLDLGRLKEEFGISPADWKAALQSSIDHLAEQR